MPHNDTSLAPERRCILTGAHGNRASLIRLALSPDGEVVPDLGAKAPGRGAWLGCTRADLDTAVAKRKLAPALARAFKENVAAPADLGDRIETGLARRVLDRLGLEMRAGHLILGSDRIGDSLGAGRVRLLLHAADAGADGCAKLDGRLGGSGRSIQLPVARDALSAALGRDNAVHIGVADSGAASRIGDTVTRWLGWRGDTPVDQNETNPHGPLSEAAN